MALDTRNTALIRVLKEALAREQESFKLKLELLELGVEV